MYLVHAMIGGRGFLRFVLIAITKMDILYMFYHFQDPIKVIRRYEGCHYTRLESYYIIFYFETDWSRIRPLPSTTLRLSQIYTQLYSIINYHCSVSIHVLADPLSISIDNRVLLYYLWYKFLLCIDNRSNDELSVTRQHNVRVMRARIGVSSTRACRCGFRSVIIIYAI